MAHISGKLAGALQRQRPDNMAAQGIALGSDQIDFVEG